MIGVRAWPYEAVQGLAIARRQLTPTMSSIQGAGADQAVIGILLEDMRRPPADARAGDEVGEQRQGKPQIVQDRGGVVIDVGDDTLGLPHALLDSRGDGEPFPVASGFRQPLCHGAQMGRTGITGAIDAMAKPRNLAPRGQRLIDIGGGALGLVDLQKHLHHFIDRPTMQWAFDGANTRHHR